MNVLLRRLLPAVILAGVVWAVASSLFTVDVTEYGLVTRFGRVVRVVSEPGLHMTAPFDRVVRLDKRVLFSRPPRSEYLTVDKKNVVIESLATWRIADPERFVGASRVKPRPSNFSAMGSRQRSAPCLGNFRLLRHLRRSGGKPLSADHLRDRASGRRLCPAGLRHRRDQPRHPRPVAA